MHADRGDGGVEQDDANHANHQPKREIALGILHLAGDEARRLPPAVREHHRRHGRSDRGKGRDRSERGIGRRAGCRRRSNQPADHHQRADGQDLEHHQPALHIASRSHSKAVHESEDGKRYDGDDAVRHGQTHKLAEIAREGDRDRRHSARLDDEQQRPAVEERRHRPVGIAEIGILSADFWPPCGELRVDQGRGKRDQPAKHPHPDNQRRCRDVTRNLGRVDENSGADDPAHDQHGRVERTKPASEPMRDDLGFAHDAPMTSRIE